ncbi:MAG: 2-amino-4-hydroxy-6-hydroxymethyldihydropteridine diphosphokinase [Kiritimatiellae bacterium]|jgi:2-amino-4-hydroxy-6-hydroxymethyldihydropteridine diphosphokinase|nr:2-amino-4-hydroxy-6-hydroxymethyldihydropteridine diphosphokinase [Kiritimatiellia bacterium]
MSEIFSVTLSLGSNIAPREEYLEKAISLIAQIPETEILKESSKIETDPVDVPEEFSNQKFLNMALLVRTSLDPFVFSKAVHDIENVLGRVRQKRRNTPRTIDIDIITFGNLKITTSELTLPHPRAHERTFVTIPLEEIAPECIALLK